MRTWLDAKTMQWVSYKPDVYWTGLYDMKGEQIFSNEPVWCMNARSNNWQPRQKYNPRYYGTLEGHYTSCWLMSKWYKWMKAMNFKEADTIMRDGEFICNCSGGWEYIRSYNNKLYKMYGPFQDTEGHVYADEIETVEDIANLKFKNSDYIVILNLFNQNEPKVSE